MTSSVEMIMRVKGKKDLKNKHRESDDNKAIILYFFFQS